MKLQLNKVSVTLNKRNILRGISLDVSGGLNFLVGLNGSGKSTLFHCILKQLPFEGEIHINGHPLTLMSTKELSREVAIVYQQIRIPFEVNAFDFTLMGRFPHLPWLGSYGPEDSELTNHWMQKLGVWEFRERNLDQISGGEFQRVLLARALVQETQVILMDEPAQSLDPKGRYEIYRMIADLSKEGKCIFCASHDAESLSMPDSRVIGLKEGELVCDRPGGGDCEAEVREKVYGIDPHQSTTNSFS